MPNTSATGGYLQPTTTSPVYDIPLDVQLQGLVSGVTGIPGSLVRPRWQPRPPSQPERDVDWCAVGIVSVTAEYGHHVQHRAAMEGSDEAEAYETLELLATFYGPGSSRLASLLRDGLWIPQNREAMQAAGLALISVDRITLLAELVAGEFIRRADIPVTLSRVVSRTYPILNLLSAQLSVDDELFVQNIIVTEN